MAAVRKLRQTAKALDKEILHVKSGRHVLLCDVVDDLFNIFRCFKSKNEPAHADFLCKDRVRFLNAAKNLSPSTPSPRSKESIRRSSSA